MEAVRNYEDLCFSLHALGCKQSIIPIILIKPSTILLFEDSLSLRHIFNYFDRRSGKGLFFYLPGYIHYPQSTIEPLFVPSNATVALSLERIGNVYYSNDSFIGFLERLESLIPNYHYYGDTELILAEYEQESEQLCFENYKRINLSDIFLKYNNTYRGYHEVENLLERILHDIVKNFTIEEISEHINFYTKWQLDE